MNRASAIIGLFVAGCGLYWLAHGFASGNTATDPLLVFVGVGNIGMGALVAMLGAIKLNG
jgi:hypothetical protein